MSTPEELQAAGPRTDRPVIVGVGASAGGLEAFQTLLATLRPTDDFALILVQHLDPEHDSLLPELLSKRTQLPVQAITDGMEVEAANVYLIPPGVALQIEDGRLRLIPFEAPRGQRRPIDLFFESLAADQGMNSAAIVLSGTGSDGSQGVRAVKEGGGLVFAQAPQDAKYDGMPRAAIATSATDMVLPAGEMMSVLRDFHSRQTGLVPALESDAEFIGKVVRNVRYRTGHDFSGYKNGTLLRRITLRMSVLGLTAPAEYLRELVQNRDEAARLFRDLLINVTSFFRDLDSFEALRDQVIRPLLEGKNPDDEVRIWVPGCSTGQEAYTLAILFSEEMARSDAKPQVSIFGTDIDDEAIAQARRGHFPNAIAGEVPQPWLDRYFTATRAGYDLRSEIRDMVRFSVQSLIKDPPFSKLDLVTCRNLLIYFDSDLQDLSMRVFQYALTPGSYLMLGSSEAAPIDGDGFTPISSEHRIYRRTAAPARPLDLPRSFRPARDGRRKKDDAENTLPMPVPVAQALLSRHAPPYMVLRDDDIELVGPGAERFVRMQTGRPSLGARSLILPDLEPALKRLLTGLSLSGAPYRKIEVELPGHGGPGERLEIGAEVLPTGERVITFVTVAPAHEGTVVAPAEDGTARISVDETYVSQLEDELENARHTIRTTVEELETSNEELKSSNEEMMSMNEELQSANEELSTTNDELQSKLKELAEVNADLANFMESTQIATVFLDREMRLRNYTPEATSYFRFAEQDRGRDIADIGARLDIDRIVAACRQVGATGQPQELDVTSADGADLSVRVAPYRSEGRGAGGVVFSIFDVSKVARYAREAATALTEARESADEVEGLYRTSPAAMGLVDEDLQFLRANPQLGAITGVAAERHLGTPLPEVAPALAELAPVLRQVMAKGEPRLGLLVHGPIPAEGVRRSWQVDVYPVRQAGRQAVGFNVTDVTQLLELQADLRRIMRELQHRVKNMLSNVIALVKRAGREEGDAKQIFDTLTARILALANTHRLLTAENWSSTALADLIDMELIRVYGRERLELRGPPIRLNARATLAIGMVLHELSTNAAKYGALSRPEGRVSVRWSRVDDGDGEMFVLRWTERGGPAVTEPDRRGFGSQLVESMITGSLGGNLRTEWEPEGLGAVIEVAWDVATEVDYDSDADPLGHADPLPGR
ncbi:chemotaxis protein CheB [Frigidibacter sp. MR17.24]|uniref:chemotaxis protein CheB n=1 Tax=Frigidibacter sp. MR17.24 TaxID=3127345 RepID=UPI003012D5AA